MDNQDFTEFIKCAKDPVYFLNNYGYVFDMRKKMVSQLNCFPYQEQVVKDYTKNKNIIILKSRQMGMSVITAGYIAWRLCFSVDERILIVANDGAGAVRFLDTVRQFLDNLPKFLLPDERTINNTKQIVFSNGSKVKAVASGKQAGRGESLTMLVLDETAFIEHAYDIWMGAGLALSVTGGQCIMISTPNGASGLYHETWVAAKKGENDFHKIELHWSLHPILSDGLEERIDEYGKKYFWSPWYQQEKDRLLNDTVKIAQELDLSFEGSAAVVIDNMIIERYEKELLNYKPICYYNYKQLGETGFIDAVTNFHVYEKPVEKRNYIIGADVGRGDGADYSTIQVIDADNLVQVAEFQGKILPDIFAEMICRVATEYNKAYIVVECNSFGLATALALKNALKYDYNRIYHSKSIKKIYNRSNGHVADKDAEIPGFQTTTKTRPLVVNSIVKYMREGQVKIHSTRLLDEFKTFVHNGDKIEHAPGYHDDLIFAFGIALLIRDTEFENIFLGQDFYKAMLSSISYSNSTIQKVQIENDKNIPNYLQDDENDLSWLMG
jgi:hypothetical protein